MNLLVQGQGAPRGKLLEQFKTTARSVLFGTDSFWMGVDVPGRCAFERHHHPAAVRGARIIRLIEAKLELIQERGGDPFTEYSLPGSDPEIASGRRAFDPDEERQRNRRHSRQSDRDENVRARVFKGAAELPGENHLAKVRRFAIS